jgi:protein transport protein SEC61 subunit gamma and related proteins
MEFKQNLSRTQKLSRTFKEYKRVLKITKKPDKTEFWNIVKITGLGILFVGLIGFVIVSLKTILKGLLI